MSEDDSLPITRFLRSWRDGDNESAGRVVAGLYAELHHIAENVLRGERPGHTLQPTALVSELYLRLRTAQPTDWRDRSHFFAVAATTLRRILVDYARAHLAKRRGGGKEPVPLEVADAVMTCSYDDLLTIHEALTELEIAEPRAARVTELKFFAGLQEGEIAKELSVSEITVKRDWKFARAWLATRLQA